MKDFSEKIIFEKASDWIENNQKVAQVTREKKARCRRLIELILSGAKLLMTTSYSLLSAAEASER